MPAKKNENFDKSKGILIVVVGVLILLLLALVVMYPKTEGSNGQNLASLSSPNGSIARLGPLEYDFSGDRAIKRTDTHLMSLKSFLIAEGEKSVGPNCNPVYHNVLMANADEKQVLLHYGCSYPSARMFAVRENEKWKLISPTNQFDTFGIPLCTHVDANNIDRAIAPVCVNENSTNDTRLDYIVR